MKWKWYWDDGAGGIVVLLARDGNTTELQGEAAREFIEHVECATCRARLFDAAFARPVPAER